MSNNILVDVLFFGRARNYDTAVALNSIGCLNRLYAGGYLLHRWQDIIHIVARIFPLNKIKRLSLRSASEIPDFRCIPIWKHLLQSAIARNLDDKFFHQRAGFSSIAGNKSKAPVIIAEQTEALEAFKIVDKHQTKKILMMTGQAPKGRQFWLEKEHLNWLPAGPITLGPNDMTRLITRETEEIKRADVILSPSHFVTESLQAYICSENKPVFEVNWPVWARDLINSRPRLEPHQPIRILFGGSVTLTKGVMYLVRALEKMDPHLYEARFVGGTNLPTPLLGQCQKVAKLCGLLPHSEIYEQYQWADVFVLPSLSEGRARVVIEAIAAGLPVITTQNAGSPIANGVNGIIIPTRDSEAIIKALDQLASDPTLYPSISDRAIRTVKSMTMEGYARELEVLLEYLSIPATSCQ